MCSHLLLVYLDNAVSVFKSCMILRGLGDIGCHLTESSSSYLQDIGF